MCDPISEGGRRCGAGTETARYATGAAEAASAQTSAEGPQLLPQAVTAQTEGEKTSLWRRILGALIGRLQKAERAAEARAHAAELKAERRQHRLAEITDSAKAARASELIAAHEAASADREHAETKLVTAQTTADIMEGAGGDLAQAQYAVQSLLTELAEAQALLRENRRRLGTLASQGLSYQESPAEEAARKQHARSALDHLRSEVARLQAEIERLAPGTVEVIEAERHLRELTAEVSRAEARAASTQAAEQQYKRAVKNEKRNLRRAESHLHHEIFSTVDLIFTRDRSFRSKAKKNAKAEMRGATHRLGQAQRALSAVRSELAVVGNLKSAREELAKARRRRDEAVRAQEEARAAADNALNRGKPKRVAA